MIINYKTTGDDVASHLLLSVFLDGNDLIMSHGAQDSGSARLTTLKESFDFACKIIRIIWQLDILTAIAFIIHESDETIFRNVHQRQLLAHNIRNMGSMGGRNDIFIFLSSEDINCSEITLGVSVLSCLRSRDSSDLAWMFLNAHVSSNSDLTGLTVEDVGLKLNITDIIVSFMSGITLSAVLFFGPLVEVLLVQGGFEKIPWNWDAYRTLLVAPLSEEVVYRGIMLALLIKDGFAEFGATVASLVLFAISHFHHLHHRKPAAVLGQVGYTSLFGALSAFIYFKNGMHLLTPIGSHMFCNYMGFPPFTFLDEDGGSLTTRCIVGAAYVFGLVSFIGYLVTS